MKELKINSKKYGEFIILLDDEDYDMVLEKSLVIGIQNPNKTCKYARYYTRENGKKKSNLLHRLIVKCPDNSVVDHINRNTLDNRKCNLRTVSQRDNCQNNGNKHGQAGVGFHKASNKWRAYYHIGDKQISLGYYNTREEAINARRAGAIW